MSHPNINDSTKRKSHKHENDPPILSRMKEWLHSLTSKQLQDAMMFSLSSQSSSSCHHNHDSNNEYDLLIEMLSSQSPPPTPIHPRAMGYNHHASNHNPITDGRWDEEQRVLRNRFERPRLFQFIERSSESLNLDIDSISADNSTGDSSSFRGGIDTIDVSGLGLPPEIAALVQEERKTSNQSKKSKSNNKKKKKQKQQKLQQKKSQKQQNHDKSKRHHYDILAKKFIMPWGDRYSLGCTDEQIEADRDILIGTRIQYGAKFYTSTKSSKIKTPTQSKRLNNQNNQHCQNDNDYNCKFDPNLFCNIGKTTRVQKQMDKEEILKMLHVVSRGRFLSTPSAIITTSSTTESQNNEHNIPFCAPWFDPRKEWFSLPLYLASRFEAALWYSFHSSYLSKDFGQKQCFELPQTVIEHNYRSMYKLEFRQCLLRSIHRSLKKFLLGEISQIGHKLSDLCLHQLLLNSDKSDNKTMITESFSLLNQEMTNFNIRELVSIRLIDLNKSKDRFRKSVIQNLEEVLSEEAGKSLVNSHNQTTTEAKSSIIHAHRKSKQTSWEKKKNRKRQIIASSASSSHKNQLKSIDENKDGDFSKDIINNSSDSTESSVDHHEPLCPYRYSTLSNDIPDESVNSDKMFILGIIDNIFVETFHKLGFKSDDEDDSGFASKVTCHEVQEIKRDEKEYILKKKKKLPQQVKNKIQNQEQFANFEPHLIFYPDDKDHVHNNQLTMKRSNKSSPSCWNKAVSQPVKNIRYDPDFFKPHSLLMPKQKAVVPQSMFHHQEKFHNHPHCEYDNTETMMNQNSVYLDSAFDSGFDRIQKSLINDLLGTEQRKGEDYFASSTAASIASSIFDLDNDQESQGDESNQIDFESERGPQTLDQFTTENNVVSESNDVAIDECNVDHDSTSSEKGNSSQKDAIPISDSFREKDNISLPKDIKKEGLSSDSPSPESPATPPPQLSPILVTLADIGKIRKLAQKECQEKNEVESDSESSIVFSSMPSSPKFPTRSWSREDLRIPLIKDDSHDFQRITSMQSYRNAAKKGFRKTPSVSSHDIEVKNTHRRQLESVKFARSASSLQSFAKEVIIDGSIHFNVCAQSESALDDHEDSSHWNVIPRAGLDESENASITKDGATTISSIPSNPDVGAVASLREERDAYRDMCLTLGSEIAKLKNLVAIEKLSSPLVYMHSHASSFDYIPDPEQMPYFYQNHNGGLDNKFTAKSDVVIHNDTQMSEDGTDVLHGSITATDVSGKIRTVNSSSIGKMRRSSTSGGRAGSDIASFDHDAGFSVFNPPTSTCFLRHESFGPADLHGLQSRLGREINSFLSSINIQLEKDNRRRELARKRLTTLVTNLWPRAQVKIYGSHVTGLCLPSSDLDFVICLPAVHKNVPADTPGALEGRNAINETNQKLLARKLKSESWIDPRSIKIIERTVVPVIKVVTKDTRSKSLQLDISFDTLEHHGLDAIKMVTDTMNHYPMVRPLVLVLKQFLLDKCLLTAYAGGLSSYCLFLMVTRYLQASYHGWADSGAYLMGFLDFYGNNFDPRSTGISVEKRCYFSRLQNFQGDNPSVVTSSNNHTSRHQYSHNRTSAPSRPFTFDPLFVEDPISPGNNVGRNSFRINKVQRVFSDAHRALVASLEWDMNSATDSDGDCSLLKCLIQREYTSI